MADDSDPSDQEVRQERLEAHEESECLLCEPAPHPNCEMHTVIQMLDPSTVPLGEDYEKHLVQVPVCMAHFEAFQEYKSGKNVEEIDVR